jgi:hypothetical protein
VKKFLIFVGLCLAGMYGFIQLRLTWQAAQNREELAQSWSRDSVQFTAIGMNNRTLYAALPGMGQADDDAFLASVVSDKHLSPELRMEGFVSLRVGSSEGRLR